MSIDFEANIISGICPLEVKFSILSDDNLFDRCDDGIKYLLFDFGDGKFSTSLNLTHSHSYLSSNTFTVILYLSSNYILFNVDKQGFIEVSSDQLSIIKLNYITVNIIYPLFNVNYQKLFCNKLAIFNITIPDDIFSQIKFVLFDFGDGTYSDILSDIHYKQYQYEGVYSVILYVSKSPIYYKVTNDIITVISETCVFYKEKIDYIKIVKIDVLDFISNKSFCISPAHIIFTIDMTVSDYNQISYMRIVYGDNEIANHKSLVYNKIYNLETCECCNRYDVSVYLGLFPIADLAYTVFITKLKYIHIISEDFDFDFISDKTQGYSPLTVNIKIIIDYAVYTNCIRYTLIDFGDGKYEYCQNKLNFTHTYLDVGLYTVAVYMSYDEITFRFPKHTSFNLNIKITIQNNTFDLYINIYDYEVFDLHINISGFDTFDLHIGIHVYTNLIVDGLDCLLYKIKFGYIEVRKLEYTCIVNPHIGIVCLNININLIITDKVLEFAKYILIDFDDSTYIYSQIVIRTYEHLYRIIGKYVVKVFISDDPIDFKIQDFTNYPYNLTCLNPEESQHCRLNLSFDECSNIRVKECINVVNVKYVLFTYISDSCPCQGFIPFTVMFTIIIDPEDFKLVKYALFDFGDGTYSIDVALMYLHIYKFVGIYTPTLYLSTTPILFSIDQYNIVVESDCISKYTRLDYVVAIYPGFIITPDTQTSTKYYTATFTVNKYSIPIDQRHPNKCIAEPLKGDIWASYEWNAFFDFGDGEFSTEFIDIYTHLYKYVGTYKATLYLSINFIDYDVVGTVINIINISETWFYSVYVIIIDIPFSIIITPNIGITPINANLKLIVDDTLFNTYIHYVLWDFNDLTISKKLDISEDHAFLAISDTITYSVTVYISAIQIKYSLGSKLTILSSDTVYSASANVTVIYPHIDFIAAPLSGYVPLSVEFTIIINIPSELQYIAAFGFNFGDNESSDINLNLIHTHIYQISGMFDVELFITDTVGSIIKYKGIITSAPNPILYPGFCIEFIIISKLLYIEAIDNPTFILTITISIAKTYTLELYVVPNNSGTISINSGAYTCSNGILNPCINSFLENSFFTFDSIPALGFDFAAWYGLSSPLISNLFLTTNSVVWAQFTPSVTCNLVIKITIAVILTISFNSTYTLTINIDII